MPHTVLIVTRAKTIESRLVREFGAQGRGLHEKVDSVADKLDDKVVRACHYVATIRNKTMHEEGFALSDADLKGFLKRCDWIDRSIRLESVWVTTWRPIRDVLVFTIGISVVLLVPMFLIVRPLLTWLKIPDAGPRHFWNDVIITALAILAVLIGIAIIIRLNRKLRR
ncbi:MAG: hypothetical protein AABZ53_14400 [Planctomycetota bacterium]